MTTINALPPAPDRADPSTFDTKADAWAAALSLWTTQTNAVGAETLDYSTQSAVSASLAGTNAAIAGVHAAAASASAGVAGAIIWVAGTYALGDPRYSPSNLQTYRCAIAGIRNTDPALDPVNWTLVSSLASVIGEAGKYYTNDGTNGFWKFTFSGVGTIQMLPPIWTANAVNFADGSIYLKTGVVVTRAAAVTAGYAVTELEANGASLPMSYNSVAGGQAGAKVMTAFGNGIFVSADTTGGVRTSTDGITWSATIVTGAGAFDRLTFCNGTFIATSLTVLYSSTNGTGWSSRVHPASGNTMQISFANGYYMAAGIGTGYYSTDLVTWGATQAINPIGGVATNGTVIVLTTGNFLSKIDTTTLFPTTVYASTGSTNWIVGYVNGKFVALSIAGSAAAAYSNDGTTWSVGSTSALAGGSTVPYGFAYGASTYVSVGNTTGPLSSPDGQTWTQRTTTSSRYGVKYVGNKFFNFSGALGVSANGMHYSTDGVTWTVTAGGPSTIEVRDVVFGNSMYVCIGGDTGQTIAYAYSSPDGITWTVRTVGGTGLHRIVYANSLFVAVGLAGSCYTSPDGITWTSRSTTGIDLSVLHYSNNTFIAAGPFQNVANYSTNGTTWTTGTLVGQSSDATGALYASAYAGGKYWHFTYGGYHVSSNLTNWTRYFGQTGNYGVPSVRLASDGAKIFLVHPGGTAANSIGISYDGRVVFPGPALPSGFGTSNQLYSLNFGGGSFLGCCTAGVVKILYSPDAGLSWNYAVPSGLVSGLYDSTYGADIWYIGANSHNITSTDPSTWTLRNLPVLNRQANSMAYGNSTFITVDTSGNVGVTSNGYDGAIGLNLSVGNITNVSSYLKVK